MRDAQYPTQQDASLPNADSHSTDIMIGGSANYR